MAKKTPTILSALAIEQRIHVVRGQRVMLDFNLAELYDVETKTLNQAVKRNPDRFPKDFAFQLTEQEFINLRSQIVTSSSGYGGRRYLPWVFTEQGVAMLSSVLNSPIAIQVSIEIVRAFVRLRRLLATPGELIAQIQQLAITVQGHDEKFRDIAEVLRQMMEPPAVPKGKFGFHPIDPKPETPKESSS